MKRHFPPDKPIVQPVPSRIPARVSNRSHNPQPEVAEIAFADAHESRGHFRERLSAVFHWLPAAVGVGSGGGGDADGGLGLTLRGLLLLLFMSDDAAVLRPLPLRALKHRGAASFVLAFGCSRASHGSQGERKRVLENETR